MSGVSMSIRSNATQRRSSQNDSFMGDKVTNTSAMFGDFNVGAFSGGGSSLLLVGAGAVGALLLWKLAKK